MITTDPTRAAEARPPLRIVRHREAAKKLGISSSKLFDMIARGQFPRPFRIVPGGRAVGWFEADVDAWIRARKVSELGDAA